MSGGGGQHSVGPCHVTCPSWALQAGLHPPNTIHAGRPGPHNFRKQEQCWGALRAGLPGEGTWQGPGGGGYGEEGRKQTQAGLASPLMALSCVLHKVPADDVSVLPSVFTF